METRRFIHEEYDGEGNLRGRKWFLHVIESKVTMQFCVTFIPKDMDYHDSKDNQGRKYMATDVGFHSPKPKWDGHTPMDGFCPWTNGKPCYYDGTSLGAREFAQFTGVDDYEAIFGMLAERYQGWFGDDIGDATPREQLNEAIKEADDNG